MDRVKRILTLVFYALTHYSNVDVLYFRIWFRFLGEICICKKTPLCHWHRWVQTHWFRTETSLAELKMNYLIWTQGFFWLRFSEQAKCRKEVKRQQVVHHKVELNSHNPRLQSGSVKRFFEFKPSGPLINRLHGFLFVFVKILPK